MLETIFFPNNAIHDGGVIMRATGSHTRHVFSR
jgi:DNA integrity scanning protein DisA with diadenylate cyclase activity